MSKTAGRSSAIARLLLLVSTSSLGVALALIGCEKRATPDECRAACDHTTQLQLAPRRKLAQMKLHEIDEAVERADDAAKVNLARLEKERAGGDPQWDEEALRKRHLAPAALRAVLERHRWDLEQLDKQRAAAIQRERDFVASEHQRFDEAKKISDAALAKDKTDAMAACTESCVAKGRSRSQAECLGRTQAVEDIEICTPK